jgi:hypothetical protein
VAFVTAHGGASHKKKKPAVLTAGFGSFEVVPKAASFSFT